MKKIIAVLCLLSFGLSCNAFELFPYKNSSDVKQLEGKVKTVGNNDVITITSDKPFKLVDEVKTAVTISAIAAAVVVPAAASTLSAAPLASAGGGGAAAGATIATLDPYVVPIDGVNYVMVKDKKTTDWNEHDLLGFDDPKNNMFVSLKGIESDGDFSKISGNELKAADIRLVRLGNDDVLLVNDRNQDYSLDKIDYIDMTNLKRTANSKATGIFGHFNVYLKTGNSTKKMVMGYVTFDTHSNLKILFK